jgi:acetylxylan esterase
MIMFVRAFAVLLSLLLQATANPRHRQSVFKTVGECPKGVHIVGVRGTLENPGFGALQDVVDHVIKQIPGSDAVAIDYPATGITIVDGEPSFNFAQYVASVMEGVSKFKAEIEDFSEQCPDTGIVILGYSQVSKLNENSIHV